MMALTYPYADKLSTNDSPMIIIRDVLNITSIVCKTISEAAGSTSSPQQPYQHPTKTTSRRFNPAVTLSIPKGQYHQKTPAHPQQRTHTSHLTTPTGQTDNDSAGENFISSESRAMGKAANAAAL